MVLDVSPHDSSGRTLQSISYFLKANKSSNAAISQHFITLLTENISTDFEDPTNDLVMDSLLLEANSE